MISRQYKIKPGRVLRMLIRLVVLMGMLLSVAPVQAATGTTVTILQDTPDPSLTGGAIWVEFQVVPNPYTGSSVDGTITVTISGDTASCSRTVNGSSSGWPYPNGWRWDCNLYPTTAGNKIITATFVPLDPGAFGPRSADDEPHTVTSIPEIDVQRPAGAANSIADGGTD